MELQQRGVEFSQLFRSHNHLRPALLEKMPPMQISRVANQNGDSPDENGGLERFDNGLEIANSPKAHISDSVRHINKIFYFLLLYSLVFLCRMLC